MSTHLLSILLLLTTGAAAQAGIAPAAIDWAKEVDKACTSLRYGLRLAASKKVAAAGDAAVRALAKEKGKDAVPVALIEANADPRRAGRATLRRL